MASEDLLKKAVSAFNALSPEQQAEMLEEQRQSWVRGNIGLSRDERGMTSPVMPRPAPAATELARYDLACDFNGDYMADIVEVELGEYVRADLYAELEREVSSLRNSFFEEKEARIVDNAVKDARIKELEAEFDQAVGVIEDRASENQALEAKLAAAEEFIKSNGYWSDYQWELRGSNYE